MEASPLPKEDDGAFQIGDCVRFIHGRKYDEIVGNNRDYKILSFYPNNLAQIVPADRPTNAQGISSAVNVADLYKIQPHGLRNGDIVTLPTKRKRRKKGDPAPPKPEFWVLTDASETDEIAITRYSSGFEGLEDFTRSDSLTWSCRRPHEVRSIGDDIFSYRAKVKAATEELRKQHDTALKPTVNNLFAPRKAEFLAPTPPSRNWKRELEETKNTLYPPQFKLTPSTSRYVESSELDSLIVLAIQYFESKGYQADYAGYRKEDKSWQICIFHKGGDLVGSLLFDEMPSFSDPNQNCPWLGGFKDFYWRPDEELEGEIYARDLVTDLEKLAASLEANDTEPDSGLEKFQKLESFLDEVFMIFQKAGYGCERVGKSLEILSKEGDDQGRFLCTLDAADIPKSIPNERVGRCEPWWWWCDSNLELSLYALEDKGYGSRDIIIAAIANISQELEKEWRAPPLEPDPFQHDAWLDDKPGIDNSDRDPFEGKISEGFGLFALT